MPRAKTSMIPQPIRLSNIQLVRLARARDRDGIGIQEHIRRGIDAYLSWLEKEAIALGTLNPNDQITVPTEPMRLADMASKPKPVKPLGARRRTATVA